MEAARVQSARFGASAHDAFARLLARLEPDREVFWAEVGRLLRPEGALIVDDSTPDKPYAHEIDLVSPHCSGRHGAVVRGISLVTAVWSDGGSVLPVYCRVSSTGRPTRRA